MPKVTYVLKQVDDGVGGLDTALIKETDMSDSGASVPNESEQWCTVRDLDQLFATCSERWGDGNWDLNKVQTAIRECEFD